MTLTMTQAEAQKILLEWVQTKFPGQFSTVALEGYGHNKLFTFFANEEPEDESQ